MAVLISPTSDLHSTSVSSPTYLLSLLNDYITTTRVTVNSTIHALSSEESQLKQHFHALNSESPSETGLTGKIDIANIQKYAKGFAYGGYKTVLIGQAARTLVVDLLGQINHLLDFHTRLNSGLVEMKMMADTNQVEQLRQRRVMIGRDVVQIFRDLQFIAGFDVFNGDWLMNMNTPTSDCSKGTVPILELELTGAIGEADYRTPPTEQGGNFFQLLQEKWVEYVDVENQYLASISVMLS